MIRIFSVLISPLLLCGCLEQGKHQVERLESLYGMKMDRILANDKALKKLATSVGFTFPPYSEIVYNGEGEWGLISRETIHLGDVHNGMVTNSNHSLAQAVDFIEVKFYPRKIASPVKALLAHWTFGKDSFKATLVYSSEQWTYCLIEQMKVNSTSQPKHGGDQRAK